MKKLVRNMKRAALAGAAIVGTALSASAQIDTNAPSVITTGITSTYNAAAAIGVGVCVVGLTVAFIYKGVLLRKR